jgi:hypothetical protein
MSFSVAQVEHLERNHNSFEAVTLLEMQFRDGTFYASDSVTPRIIGGNTYQGVEGVLSATGIERKGGFQASSVTYRLHALTGPLAAAVDSDRAQYRDRTCVRSVQLYADGVAVGDPIVLHKGKMDSAKFRKSGSEDYVEVVVRDLFSDRLNKPEYYTDADQQGRFSGDKAFQYVASFVKQTTLTGWLFG